MDRVGISFKSALSSDEVRARYIQPLREALESSRGGIYSNYLRQADADSPEPAEHLLVFQVREFQAGLQLLRVAMQEIGPPEGMTLHNLDPSDPMY